LSWHESHTDAFVRAVSSENVLFGHSVHALLPVSGLNVPDTQGRHGPPSGPV
jgi:hypothetical protein